MNKPQILIIDCGSQYTLVIQRTLAEIGLQSEIVEPEKSLPWIKTNKPKGIILSGGSASVYDNDAPKIPKEILILGIPILGICYGMQWIAHIIGDGALVIRETNPDNKGYGATKISISPHIKDTLFEDIPDYLTVWSNHGDMVGNVPKGFVDIAHSATVLQAMSNREKKIWGVQFHPEVTHTELGKTILKNFVYRICECTSDWHVEDIIKKIEDEIEKNVNGSSVSLGVSGGVDSSTLGMIAANVLGHRLHSFIIDHGAMRHNEIEEVKNSLFRAGLRNLKVVDASEKFIREVEKYTDAEKKRNIAFKPMYTETFIEESKSAGAGFILQGTIAPDEIESGGVGKSALIKSHHNVGLDFGIPQLKPFSGLFKYQVRDIARKIGLPKEIAERQPFPGPGLFVRVVGIPATRFNIGIVRKADDTVTKILKRHKLYDNISQLVVALLGVNTVGVKGDDRVYKPIIAIRPVQTVDFMTTEPYYIPREVEAEINSEVCKHPEVCRAMFDYTPKPPATTEFE